MTRPSLGGIIPFVFKDSWFPDCFPVETQPRMQPIQKMFCAVFVLTRKQRFAFYEIRCDLNSPEVKSNNAKRKDSQ